MFRRDTWPPLLGVVATGIVAMGADCAVICRRDRDCDKWQRLTLDSPLRAADHSVAVGPGGALAVAVEDDAFPYFHFEPRDSGTDVDLRAVVVGYGDCPSIAVGDRGTIRYAHGDEPSWHAPETPAATPSLSWVTADCPFTTAVAVGDAGTVLVTNGDVERWEARSSGTDRPLRSVALAGELLVVVGEAGTVLRSADGGDTWAPVAVATTADLLTVALTFTSTYEGQPIFGWIGAADGGLWESKDDGETWVALDADIPEPVRQFSRDRCSFGNFAQPLNFLGDTELWVWDRWEQRLAVASEFDEPVHAFTCAGAPNRGWEPTVFVDGAMFVYRACGTCGP